MSLADLDIRQAAREHLAAHGIDPDAGHERTAFSLAEHMVANAMHLLAAHVPQRFQDAEPDHPDVLRWVDTFLADRATTPNLFLRGPVGTGKTWQAYGALRRVVLASARSRQRLSWRATTFPAFNAAMRPQPDEGHIRELEDLQQADLLLLDDLGAGKTTDWTEDTLVRLIDARWSQRRPTIVTTNMTSDRLVSDLDERVVSRLRESVRVALNGPDRRSAA